MATVVPFRGRSKLAIVLGALAAAVFAFAATTIFLNWQSEHAASVEIIHGTGYSSNPIEVIDGDTVRMNGTPYRLTGFDTPERGDKARCEDERRRAEKATQRLRDLIATGNARLTRVACACQPGEEGTSRCNYGRLCGSLAVGGRDVGAILIGEGLAHSYVCSGSNCPRRQPWCDRR